MLLQTPGREILGNVLSQRTWEENPADIWNRNLRDIESGSWDRPLAIHSKDPLLEKLVSEQWTWWALSVLTLGSDSPFSGDEDGDLWCEKELPSGAAPEASNWQEVLLQEDHMLLVSLWVKDISSVSSDSEEPSLKAWMQLLESLQLIWSNPVRWAVYT